MLSLMILICMMYFMGDVANKKIADAYRSLHKELLGFLRAKTRGESPEIAQDIVHDTFAYWLKNSSQEIRHPKAYLIRIAQNLLHDHWRRQQVRERSHVVEPSAATQSESIQSGIYDDVHDHVGPISAQPDIHVEARQRLMLLEQAIQSLPARQREAFLLRKLEHLSNTDIAERMQISLRMVEQHLQSAMLHCKRQVYHDQGSEH